MSVSWFVCYETQNSGGLWREIIMQDLRARPDSLQQLLRSPFSVQFSNTFVLGDLELELA